MNPQHQARLSAVRFEGTVRNRVVLAAQPPEALARIRKAVGEALTPYCQCQVDGQAQGRALGGALGDALEQLLQAPTWRARRACTRGPRGRDRSPGRTRRSRRGTTAAAANQAIWGVYHYHATGSPEAGIRKVLIICPASVKAEWKAEIERFSDRSCQLVIGGPGAQQYGDDVLFKVCNYERAVRDILAIERTALGLIILDEGQRIKNWEAKTTAVFKALRSPFALVLSGTPLENRLDELHSVVAFIDDRRLGPAFRFLNRHRVVHEKGKVQLTQMAERQLQEQRDRPTAPR